MCSDAVVECVAEVQNAAADAAVDEDYDEEEQASPSPPAPHY